MNNTTVNDADWTLLASGVGVMIAQAHGWDIEIAVASSKPSASAKGFSIPVGIPVDIPNIAALGGNVYGKGDGDIRHASA